MSSSSTGRNAARLGEYPSVAAYTLPVAAAAVIYQATLVMVPYAGTDNGYLKPAAAGSVPCRIVGVAQRDCDNSAGAAGVKTVDVAVGVFGFENSSSTDAITAAMVGQPCYAADDATVARTRGTTGQRPYAGRVVLIEDGKVYVEVGTPRDADGIFDIPLVAAADYSTTGQFLFMGVNSSGQAVLASAAGQDVVGVLQNAPASGAIGLVRMGGTSQVYAGGTVAAGSTVATTSGGKTKAAQVTRCDASGASATAALTGSFAMGTALTAGSTDALHYVYLSRMGAIPGTAA